MNEIDALREGAPALIRDLHTPAFPATLARLLRGLVPYDSTVIFAYIGDKPPIDLFHDIEFAPEFGSFEEYQCGAYLLDPFFHACQRGVGPAVHRLKDFAPDHFFRSEYYRAYYAKTNIIDEIGIFTPFTDGGTIVISVSRHKGSRPFSRRDVARCEAIEPLVRAAVLQHWRNPEMVELATPADARRYDTLPARIRAASGADGRPVLTEREAEVVSLILRGHSSVSVAVRLGISAGTVKVHRKNIYAKLGISSQAELFSVFLPLLTGAAA